MEDPEEIELDDSKVNSFLRNCILSMKTTEIAIFKFYKKDYLESNFVNSEEEYLFLWINLLEVLNPDMIKLNFTPEKRL